MNKEDITKASCELVELINQFMYLGSPDSMSRLLEVAHTFKELSDENETLTETMKCAKAAVEIVREQPSGREKMYESLLKDLGFDPHTRYLNNLIDRVSELNKKELCSDALDWAMLNNDIVSKDRVHGFRVLAINKAELIEHYKDLQKEASRSEEDQ